MTETVLSGRYRLGGRIARGHLGEVWRCVDESTGGALAVKVLRPELSEDRSFAERLRLGWAREMAWIDHAAVVRLYDHGHDPRAGLFIVMEYVPGRSLRRLLDREPVLRPDRALELVARIADAVHVVHERGIAHRELRPGKVIVRPDATVALSLFGLARQVAGNQVWASVDPGYVSPEQLAGQAGTYQSDIFSLGAIAYECLAGRPAFEGDNRLDVVLRVVRDSPAPLPDGVPAEVVNRAIAKDPSSRWPTAAAFAEAARVASRALL